MLNPATAIMSRPMRVLVVEDETRFREFLVETLSEMGAEPYGVSSAVRALERFESLSPDALLLDLNLPRLHGLAFLEKIRARGRQAPVVVLTGVGDLPAAQEAIRLGVVDFLTKPCHLGEIERALDRCRRRIAETPTEPPSKSPTEPRSSEHPTTIDEIERRAILEALDRRRGNRSAAAADLGISRRTLYNRISRYRAQGRWPRDLHPPPCPERHA
jgi:DNA-binding NtrC family response regulator